MININLVNKNFYENKILNLINNRILILINSLDFIFYNFLFSIVFTRVQMLISINNNQITFNNSILFDKIYHNLVNFYN